MREALGTLVERPYPLHPVLFAAFPVLSLFAFNIREARFVGLMLPSLGVAVGATLVVLIVATLVLRDARKGALLVSAWVVLFFSFGHVINFLQSLGATGEEKVVAAVWAVLGLVAVIVAIRAGRRLAETTRVLNVVAAFLVVASIVRIAWPATSTATVPQIIASAEGIELERSARLPDVYLIVLDRYGSRRSLLERFGYDNRPFLDYLRRRGFFVADRARANYPKTDQSLAASLNLDYLHELLGPVRPEHQDELGLPWPLMRNHVVGRLFQSIGYRHVHIGSWYDATRIAPGADVRFEFETTEFSQILIATTPLLFVPRWLGVGPKIWDPVELRRQAALYQFEKVAEVQAMEGPTFAFAHVILPHPPYVFDADGSAPTRSEIAGRSEAEMFRQQIEFLNGKLRALVDQLLAVPEAERPIVVLQADEGPQPAELQPGTNYPWPTLSDESLRMKFGILNALYLPENGGSALYRSISPVNTWRLVFNEYFGAELPLLPDRSYVFRDLDRLYEFVDVTARVR